MVLIHTKGIDEKDQFLYDTTVDTLIGTLKKELVNIYNLRSRTLKLVQASLELADHGPLRPENLRGLSEKELKLQGESFSESKEERNFDPNHFRTGIPLPPEKSDHLKKVLKQVETKLSIEQVEKGCLLQIDKVKSYFDSIVQALEECYPNWDGVPSYDFTRLLIEQDTCLKDELMYNDSCLWWAGKVMVEEQQLKERIGKNEKTKIIVKIQPKKFGAPVREPRIDQETYKAMLAYYHKKEKEEKELEEDDDDSYLNSEWANPLNLQKKLHGDLENIKWKP